MEPIFTQRFKCRMVSLQNSEQNFLLRDIIVDLFAHFIVGFEVALDLLLYPFVIEVYSKIIGLIGYCTAKAQILDILFLPYGLLGFRPGDGWGNLARKG